MLFSHPFPSFPFSLSPSSLDLYHFILYTCFVFHLNWSIASPKHTMFVIPHLYLVNSFLCILVFIFKAHCSVKSFLLSYTCKESLASLNSSLSSYHAPSMHTLDVHWIVKIRKRSPLQVKPWTGIAPPSLCSPTGLAQCFGHRRGSELNWNWTELNKLSIYEIICFRVARIKWLLQWQYYSNSLISFDPRRS